jgi:hypothetical protein
VNFFSHTEHAFSSLTLTKNLAMSLNPFKVLYSLEEGQHMNHGH